MKKLTIYIKNNKTQFIFADKKIFLHFPDDYEKTGFSRQMSMA